jgi:hypothetical protein
MLQLVAFVLYSVFWVAILVSARHLAICAAWHADAL